MLDDKEELRLGILLSQHKRLYEIGGRAPPHWVVRLVAVGCGIVPMLLLMPFSWEATPRLRFVPFEPIVLDLAIPIAAVLISCFTVRWAAPIQRRPAVVIATLVATIPSLILYLASGYSQGLIAWTALHFLNTTVTALAIVVAAMLVGGSTPRTAKHRWSASDIPDRVDRAPQPDETSGCCTRARRFARILAYRVA